MSLKYQINRCRDWLDYTRHGQLHRSEGPAEIWIDSITIWYRYGMLISEHSGNDEHDYDSEI